MSQKSSINYVLGVKHCQVMEAMTSANLVKALKKFKEITGKAELN